MIGKSDQGQGYKTKEIERVTGFCVSISHLDRINNIPVCITLKTMYPFHQADKVKAKVMIETSLLEFAEFDGGKAKLLEEWDVATSRKRKPDDTLAAHQNDFGISQRPIKTQKSQEEISSEMTCTLTVPLWVMRKCSDDKELFCKLFIILTHLFLPRFSLSPCSHLAQHIFLENTLDEDVKPERLDKRQMAAQSTSHITAARIKDLWLSLSNHPLLLRPPYMM